MREKEEGTSVLFLRHGITDYPIDRIYSAEDDPALNETGHRQAAQLAEWFKGKRAAGLYVSSTARTRQTAQPIAEALGLDPVLLPDFRERDFGVWEGLTFDEIAARYPEGHAAWKKDPIAYKPEKGESILDLKERVDTQTRFLIEKHPKETVIVVSHVGPIRVALTGAMGMPVEGYRRLNIHYGSATRVDYGKRQPNLIYLNHLPSGRAP